MAFTKITAAGIDTSGTITTQSISVSGVSTVGSLSIGATSVISSARQLQNIASLDATTTATIESAVANAPNTFTDLSVSGISTLGVTSATNLTAQSLNVSGIITATQLSTGASGTGVNISTDTISGPATLTIDPAAVGDNTGAVRIKGDLYVDGTQFIVNSTTIELADFNVGIASTVGTNALLDGAGIGIGSIGIRKTLTWNNSSTALKSSEDFDISSGKVYRVNGTSVLSNNTLGSGVVTSSLTSVGTLSSLSVTGVTIDGSGNVGINDTSPSTRISGFIVRGTDTRYFTVNKANAQPTWRYDDNGTGAALLQNLGMTAANHGMGIQFQLGDSAANSAVGGSIYCLSEQTWTATASTKDSYLRFDTALDGVSTEAMRIKSDGSVGIGTINPSAKLDVEDNSASGYIAEFRQKNASNTAQILIDSPSNGESRPVLLDMSRAGVLQWSIGQGYLDTSQSFHISTSTLQNGYTGSKLSITPSGSVTTSSQPRANIAKTGGTTLATTATKITFTSETYDVGDNFSSSRYTAPVSGYYLVSTSLNISASANDVTISVYKNGAVYGGMIFAAQGANIRFNYSITGVVYLSASDYIEIFGVVNTGTLAVDNSGFLSVALLG